MSEPNTESIFGTPLYYNELDNYEKVQQDFDEPLVNTTWEMNPQWGQTHYLSDPTFKEHLFEMYPLENFKKEIDKNLKLFCKSLNFNWRPILLEVLGWHYLKKVIGVIVIIMEHLIFLVSIT